MLKILSSLRVTVVCLLLLFVLTFWGTIAQVHQGLYAAQERFFNSFFFLAAGVIPFPGAQLVLWVLFVNLISMLVLSFKKYCQWQSLGLLLIHLGLILYFVAAFIVFHFAKESYVHLGQGDSTDTSLSYQDWELVYGASQRPQKIIPVKELRLGDEVLLAKVDLNYLLTKNDLTFKIKEIYTNCEAILKTKKNLLVINASGINELRFKSNSKEKEENIPGIELTINWDGRVHKVLLFGRDATPTTVMISNKKYQFILRRQRFPLPFKIRLDHFQAEFHPGTQIPKSFESMVTLTTDGLERKARIFMNNPLRYKDYTVYQAFYDTDSEGRQYSTLAVVKNRAKLLPYLACFAVFIGLALHFLIMAFQAKARL